MKCPKCGHENREEAGFCVQCARPLVVELLCPECG
ncbi:MAG: zinc-ribbon domain-containing protein, partial [Chloroflexi bacterium]|nr:zinc-ribbon domain-containing protein [Chloroflexota bacterium]